MRTITVVIGIGLFLAGCTAPEADTVAETSLTPGSTGHVLLQLQAAGDGAEVALDVEDDAGLDVLLPERLHHNGSEAAGWVGFAVPEDAAGTHEVVLRATGATQELVAITVNVAEGEGLGEGASVLLDYVIRSEDGTVAVNTRADVESSPLERAAGYQPLPEHAPQPLRLSTDQLGEELYGPLISLPEGHSITIPLPDFFGATEQEQPREETIERRTSVPRFETMDRRVAQQQGIIDASTREGDVLKAGAFDYLVETLNETTLRVELDVEEGDRVTFYDAWADATVVEEQGPQQVVFRTDPPVEEGAPFTWQPGWPEATEVVRMDNETILLRHSPEVGHTYQAQTQQGPVEQEILAVEDDLIVVSLGNPHPLAGQDAYLEATMVGRNDRPQMP